MSFRPALLVLGGLWCNPVLGLAQQPGGSVAHIRGFAGLPWGTTSEAIIQVRGRPDSTLAGSGGGVLFYTDYLVGTIEVVVAFNVNLDKGLIYGSYLKNVIDDPGCLQSFRLIEESIAEKYAAIPAHRGTNSDSASSCRIPSQPTRSVQWYDPTTDSAISLFLNSGAILQVEYLSPYVLEQRRRQHQKQQDKF